MTRDPGGGGGLTWSDVRHWQGAQVEAGAVVFSRLAADLESLQDELDQARPTGWSGASADAAAAARHGLLLNLETAVAQIAMLRSATYRAGDEVTALEADLADLQAWAAANQLSIAADGTVTDTAPLPMVGTPPNQLVDLDGFAERGELVTRCVSMMQDLLYRAQAIDEELASTLASILADRVRVTSDIGLKGANLAGTQAWLASHPPPAAGTPQQNATWWKDLDPTEQATVIAHHPGWIANLDGVDYTSRDKANRALLRKHWTDLMGERDRREAELKGFEAAPRDYSNPRAWLTQRERLAAQVGIVDAKLASLKTVESILTQPGRQLIALDLTHERAQAAIAVGDVDTADHVAVFTPGLTSTVDGMKPYDRNMVDLRDRATKIAKEEDHGAPSIATVTWLGYQAPQVAPSSLLSGNSVTLAGAARDGGQSLARFYQGINATRDTDPDLTALGHSYGSTTTGYALTGDHTDTGVDQVAFFGSPGVPAWTANGVHVPPGQVYYAEATGDPVGDFHRFGPDLTNMPGVKHLDTGASLAPDGNPLAGIGGPTSHVHYLDDGTTSQYNLAALTAGHPEVAIEGNNRGITDSNPLLPFPLNLWGIPQ